MITLTDDQVKAHEAFVSFLMDDREQCFVIQGYAGTGKSTLVEYILDEMPHTLKMAKLINPSRKDLNVALTATTNKAAEALADISGREVVTIQRLLGLRVSRDFKNGNTELVPIGKNEELANLIIVIDECSFIDNHLLNWIEVLCKKCKLVFIGDPAQLASVKGGSRTPVFTKNYPTAKLTKVVRQAEGSPIIDLATAFRGVVNTGKYFSFKPDGISVSHLPRNEFDNAILDEFGRTDYKGNDARVLAWTNKTVIAYNHAIRDKLRGAAKLQVGDYAICNKFYSNRKHRIKTDEIVLITDIEVVHTQAIPGSNVEMNHRIIAFSPDSLDEKKALYARLKKQGEYVKMRIIDETWVDLRAAYSCTINKSQGSTYKTVFLDLDDVKKCNQPNVVARMLYVAVSRASDRLVLTGDIV